MFLVEKRTIYVIYFISLQPMFFIMGMIPILI